MTKPKKSYFRKRIYDTLGFTQEYLNLPIKTHPEAVSITQAPILYEDKDGNIIMTPFSLDGELHHFTDKSKAEKLLTYEYVRFNGDKPLPMGSDGKEYKARPKHRGGGTWPMIGPNLYRNYCKFQNEEEENPDLGDTLYVTEGYLKALKADFHDIPIVGLSSITHYRNKKEKSSDSEQWESAEFEPYYDIIKLIETCGFKNLVLIHDADLFQVKYKDPERVLNYEDADMSKRLFNFYNAAVGFFNTYKRSGLALWYGHIHEKYQDTAKGLDDIIIKYWSNYQDVLNDLRNYDQDNVRFFRFKPFNTSEQKRRLKSYFALNSVKKFYHRFEDIIKEQNFIFKSTLYSVGEDEHTGDVKLHQQMSKDANQFLVVADKLYKRILKPRYAGLDKNNQPVEKHVESMEVKNVKITERRYDNGKNMIDQVLANNYYDGFVNLPGHGRDYRQVIGTHYNSYKKLRHPEIFYDINDINDYDNIPQIENSITLCKHIFGDDILIGLDYLTLLYKVPQQKLPILCLYSRENKTGKSTFMDWLKMIFQENANFVRSEDFTEKFNADWISSLVIFVDEALVDKKATVEKIKFYSTAKYVKYEIKGGASGNADNHLKIVMASNNLRFITIDDRETRFWIRHITQIEKKDSNIDRKLLREVPFFIHYLTQRQVHYEKKDRMWFEEKLIENDLLRKVKNNSQSWNESAIREIFVDLFLSNDHPIIDVQPNNLLEILKQHTGDHNLNTKQLKFNLSLMEIEQKKNSTTNLFNLGWVDGRITLEPETHNRSVRFYRFGKWQFITQAQDEEAREKRRKNDGFKSDGPYDYQDPDIFK